MSLPTDLCEVADVLGYIGNTSSTYAQEQIQQCVSAASLYILSACSVDNFNTADYSETYSGNGASRLFLRNWPVTGITALTINGVAITASTAWNTPGYTFDKTSLILRPGTLAFPNTVPGIFTKGIANVQVSYTAGFATIPADLAQAAIEIAANTYVKGQNPMKSSISSGVGGATGTVKFGPEITATAQQTICRYQRVWGTSN